PQWNHAKTINPRPLSLRRTPDRSASASSSWRSASPRKGIRRTVVARFAVSIIRATLPTALFKCESVCSRACMRPGLLCVWCSVAFPKGRLPMKPHQDQEQHASEQRREPPKKRFRLVRLEERIAPSGGSGQTGQTNGSPCRLFTDPCHTFLCKVGL